MLNNMQKTTSLNATQAIGNEVALRLNASISVNGSFSINETIINKSLYFENEEEIRADREEFRAAVEAISKDIN